MGTVTFNHEVTGNGQKEKYEWLRIWCDDTEDTSLPRIALIGDSITEGYYTAVCKKLQGIARVDYMATSYSITSVIYREAVKQFLADSRYAAVHFNYGLHAAFVEDGVYAACCREILQAIPVKTVIATSTTPRDETLVTETPQWKDIILARNRILTVLSAELGLGLDDLYRLDQQLPGTCRQADGVHFTDEGYGLLAQSVVDSLLPLLSSVR